MKKIPFKDLPSTDTPIDSANLNLLQDNVEDAINEVKDDIIYVEYSTTYGPANQANYSNRFTINTSVPSGYKWVGYEIVDNGYANAVITWILYSSSAKCIIGFYTLAALQSQLTFKVRGIYKKV